MRVAHAEINDEPADRMLPADLEPELPASHSLPDLRLHRGEGVAEAARMLEDRSRDAVDLCGFSPLRTKSR